MEKKSKKDSFELLKDFAEVCNLLASEVNDMLFDGSRDFYWVGDNVGGLCDFGDEDFLTPDEMYLIVSYKVDYDRYAQWRDWNVAYGDVIHNVNLWSWIHGYDVLALSQSREYERVTSEGE